uniref:NADH-ubiquinone oxidoreductase chain 2 n=1 Tax=Neurigona zhejiangensis TaxID=2779314 RepID=A0A7M3UZP7_9MUSC|nr:NADH dehydrogenase subunit 2 [Neurigona zhejiangensis]QOL12424.1 NADH dehydrogenase subunit 2 [Neurigona zhejiangensis]
MFKNSSKIMFIIIVMMGTMMAVSANSWVNSWMGLEINLLAFIPLMNDTNNLKSTEASLKYFLTQALASSILLFSVIMYYMKMNYTFMMEENQSIKMIIMTSLLMKSGAAPFHFWFPEVMEGLSWINSLILMTCQKLAPFMLLSYIISKSFSIMISIMTITIGSLGGLNQTSLRKIMAFSSINHLGWMLSALMINSNLWILYFIFYSMLSASIIMMFNTSKLFHFNQLFSNNNSIMMKLSTMINFLSLGGLPPFLGFFPKWMVIQQLSINNQSMLVFFLMVMTLITLFFYLRMCFSSMMINHQNSNWMINVKNSYIVKIYLFNTAISILGLPLMTSMFYMM